MHAGHIAFARKALEGGLDKVFLLVEPRPRRKQGVHALEHRIAMAERATRSHKGLGVIQLEQAMFSPHETLPLLQARFKGSELVLLFGDDVIHHMIDHLTQWPHIEDLAETTSLLIATRQHDHTELKARLHDLTRYGIHFRYEFIELAGQYASSSEIRLALRHGRNVTDLSQSVRKYIVEQGLYASSEGK